MDAPKSSVTIEEVAEALVLCGTLASISSAGREQRQVRDKRYWCWVQRPTAMLTPVIGVPGEVSRYAEWIEPLSAPERWDREAEAWRRMVVWSVRGLLCGVGASDAAGSVVRLSVHVPPAMLAIAPTGLSKPPVSVTWRTDGEVTALFAPRPAGEK